MKNTLDLKIFLVEFGKPDLSSYTSYGAKQEPLFVIAKSFDEASKKAFCYIEHTIGNSESIISEDGSLNLEKSEILQIKSIKIVSNVIIM